MHSYLQEGGRTRGAPRGPTQLFALIVGGLLLALGVLTLVIGGAEFATAKQARGQDFLIWTANGWNSVVWMAFGALGLAMANQIGAARIYALVSGVISALLAVWGSSTAGTCSTSCLSTRPTTSSTPRSAAWVLCLAWCPSRRIERPRWGAAGRRPRTRPGLTECRGPTGQPARLRSVRGLADADTGAAPAQT